MQNQMNCARRAVKRSSTWQNRIMTEAMEPRTMLSTYFVTTAGDGAASVKSLFPGLYVANTLRAAVNASNAAAGSDLIVLNPLLHGTIALNSASGEIAITGTVTIQGFGADRQAISGGGAIRIFNIASGAHVSIRDLALTGGQSTNFGGGAIRNSGTLSLIDCAVHDNNTLHADGAGLINFGTLDIRGCTFENNTATDGGGGALVNDGTATIVNSTFAGNTGDFGGALSNNDSHTMLMTNCTVTRNHANISGGGVSGVVFDQGTTPSGTRFNNCIIAGNTFNPANGGLNNDLYGFFDSASSNNLIGDLGFAKGLDLSKNIAGGIEEATPVINARLAPMGYYGGDTRTAPPLSGSPAINAGSNALLPAGTYTDQRGFRRVAGGTVDIGAVEAQSTFSFFSSVSTSSSTSVFSSIALSSLFHLFFG
jgi:hypothetical protein